MAKDKYGLRPLKKDKRDFQLGALFFLPRLDELPESFELTTQFPIKNQGQTDYCSAYASCGMSEIQEKVELYPEYSFALSKEVSGDPDAWGQDLRSAMKSHTKYGAIAQKHAPEAQNGDLRRFSSYPITWLTYAKNHQKQSYFKITGQHDSFDNIKASIFKHKSAVCIGVIWGWSIGDYILNTVVAEGFGHAMYVTGWDEDGLIVVNSYGERAGKNGKHRMTRNVINAFVPRFGAMMMIDIPPEAVLESMDMLQWTNAGFFKRIWILIKRLW